MSRMKHPRQIEVGVRFVSSLYAESHQDFFVSHESKNVDRTTKDAHKDFFDSFESMWEKTTPNGERVSWLATNYGFERTKFCFI